jgi:hypothetical protein
MGEEEECVCFLDCWSEWVSSENMAKELDHGHYSIQYLRKA